MVCILTSKWIFKIRYIYHFLFRMEFEQYTMIKFVHFKKMKAAEIHNELVLCFDDDNNACTLASI
jgi:hypothetical protein